MKILIKILLLTFFLAPISANAADINPVAEKWFKTFSTKIITKYNTDNEIKYFKWFSEKLNKLKITKKLTSAQTWLVNDLITLSNELLFKITLENKEKNNKKTISNLNYLKNFKYKSYNDEHLFIKDWIWYTYIFDNHLYFDETNSKLNISTLNNNNIYSSNSIVFIRDDWKVWFINKFKTRKLITDDIIKWISWKYNFLLELRDDKKKLNYETDEVFKSLKKIVKNITTWKNKEDKIKILYEYVIEHVKYKEDFTFDQANFFSWIHTFATWDWVCEWYVKLYLYMLNFSWIDDVRAIRWYVLDAPDFPDIWHAWISIWNFYFDPTFDDPIGQTKTKKFKEYKYYNLPYDLFYTNRYTFEKIPSFLKSKSLEYRKTFINKRIASLLSKYKNSWYNLLKPFLFKQANNIIISKDLDLLDISKIIWIYNVNNWSFIKNWVKKNISNIKYYSVNNENINWIIDQLNYELDWCYLFYWKLDNWNFEYRLAYDIKIN